MSEYGKNLTHLPPILLFKDSNMARIPEILTGRFVTTVRDAPAVPYPSGYGRFPINFNFSIDTDTAPNDPRHRQTHPTRQGARLAPVHSDERVEFSRPQTTCSCRREGSLAGG